MKSRQLKCVCYLIASACYLSIATISFFTARYAVGLFEAGLGAIHIVLGVSHILDHRAYSEALASDNGNKGDIE